MGKFELTSGSVLERCTNNCAVLSSEEAAMGSNQGNASISNCYFSRYRVRQNLLILQAYARPRQDWSSVSFARLSNRNEICDQGQIASQRATLVASPRI